MKRLVLYSTLLALGLLLAACGPGFGEVTVLTVDQDTGTVEVETADGEVFTIIAPPGFDLSLVQRDMTINLSDGLEEAFEDAYEDAQDGEAGEEEDEDDDNANSAFCKNPEDEHPALSGLASDSGIAYADLLTLFCEQNYGVGELRQAVRIASQAGMDFEDVIALHAELGSWGAVRQELDLTGKPENPGNSNNNNGNNGNNGNGNGNNDDDDD